MDGGKYNIFEILNTKELLTISNLCEVIKLWSGMAVIVDHIQEHGI